MNDMFPQLKYQFDVNSVNTSDFNNYKRTSF